MALAALVALVVALVTASLWIKRHRAKLPAWDQIDATTTLKVGASTKKLEAFAADGPIDYIIIGSGLGGLTTAALLSKVGFRVLVLEQHDIAGGATHTFEDQGFEFDVGVHYLGERLTSKLSACRRLFDFVSDGKLEWCKSHSDYDRAVNTLDGEEVRFSEDHAANLALLEGRCPGSMPALRRYRFASQLAKVSAFALFFLKLLPSSLAKILTPLLRPVYEWAAGRTARKVMENCGLSDELIGILTYLYGDYGLPPGKVPFIVQALLETHYQGGAFFPRGGAGSIAKTIVAGLQRRGSQVMVRAPVTEITVEPNGRGGFVATGVKCKGAALVARRGVISNAGAVNTFERLLSKEAAEGNLTPLRELKAMEPSVQLIYLFVGLDATDKELNLPACNYWLLHGWDHDKAWEEFSAAKSFEDVGFLPAVFLSLGSAKDDAFAKRHPGKATLQLLAPVKYEWFQQWEGTKLQHRGAEYDQFKLEWQQRLLERLYKHLPQTKVLARGSQLLLEEAEQWAECRLSWVHWWSWQGHVVYSNVASPLTTNHYLAATRGACYGLAHTLPRFSMAAQGALHTQTKVDRLTLVGQDALLAGVVSALASGAIGAGYLSKRALLRLAVEEVLA